MLTENTYTDWNGAQQVIVMTNPVVMIDCDGVLVDTGAHWHKWLHDRFELNDSEVDKWIDGWGHMQKKPYNLTKLYQFPTGVTGFEYWNNQSLYDGLSPTDGAVSALQEIKSQLNMDIVVVSKVVGNHFESKQKWIRNHFPMVDAIFLTEAGSSEKAKTFARCDAVVEDSLIQLIEFANQDVLKLHYQTDYVQEGVETMVDIYPVSTWNEVVDWLESVLDV